MNPLTYRPWGWRSVIGGFSIVAGVLIVLDGVALYHTFANQTQANLLVRDAVASVELAGRMQADIHRRQLLLHEHILEKAAAAMSRVEVRLHALETDFDAAAREYEAHVIFEGEAGTWRQLQRELTATEAPVAQILDLSRQNRDKEALAALAQADQRFGLVEKSLRRLVRINQEGAASASARVEALHRSSRRYFALMGAVGVALTLFVGLKTGRAVRQREEQVVRAAALLEARNRELDAFAGRVAHDLRGPLTTISLAGQVLAEMAPRTKGTVATQRRAIDHMESLIRDLLDLSRVDGYGHGVVCDPAVVAAKLQEELAPRLGAERVKCRVDVAPARVRCPEGLLRQILANLTDNAVKYRRPEVEPMVEIRGAPVAQGYELNVTDNGIGMSAEETDRAFEPFWRASRAAAQPGTGLGLAIVKRIVDASEGSISVVSRPGLGTTFRIRLHAQPEPSA